MTGKVGFRDYRNYLSYSLGTCGMILYLLVCTAASICQLSVSLFLADWSAQPFEEQQKDFYP